MKKLIIFILIILIIIGLIIINEIKGLRIDHQCYMMEDEEFFEIEMCKPYWKYRLEGVRND